MSSLGDFTTILCSSISFAAALAVCPLSFLEHGRSVRPSAGLELYILSAIVVDMVQLERLLNHRSQASFLALAIASACLRLLLFAMETRDKRSLLREPYRDLGPEETAGIISRVFVWWVNPILVQGITKMLSDRDLPPLDSELSSGPLRLKLQRIWDQGCMFSLLETFQAQAL